MAKKIHLVALFLVLVLFLVLHQVAEANGDSEEAKKGDSGKAVKKYDSNNEKKKYDSDKGKNDNNSDNKKNDDDDDSEKNKKDKSKKDKEKKRSRGICKVKKYKHCYNQEKDCPDECPDQCTLDCPSCEPYCPATPPPPSNSGSTPEYPTPSPPPPPSTPTITPTTPSPPPPSTPTITPTAPSPPPPPSTPTITPTTPSPPPPPSTPTITPMTPSPPPPPSTPTITPTTPSPPPPAATPATPSPPPPTGTPGSTPTSPSPDSGAAGQKRARCRNRNYPQCYNSQHVCPSACPGGCEVDCVSCKPVCKCDQPGAVCQDPRFIGGDGITFYFHGKKDRHFCLLSDPSLHINAHFIGRRNPSLRRDFTWVDSIGILFGPNTLFLAALKTTAWDDSLDRLALSFNGHPITLAKTEGATWRSETTSAVRTADTNAVVVEVEGLFRITAKVVPITKQDSRVHNYGVTDEDCLAHLDLQFKFFSLSDEVSGVLGQTYKPDYISPVNVKATMPVIGGEREFSATGLFTTDCAAARFRGVGYVGAERSEFPSLSCASGMDGPGVVCKK